ncbi:hypothetical protein [Brevibacterium sp.]|uniref:Uncharacterized protein n=1 Tax=Brevibacterium antiquum CNRZ 918 TaxID=1255637 RepID=A0A2H1J362_9MICO|nr:hypothetical protein [Brevibacterium sp.]SMX81834.1 hypothetical protein BANT918_01378 [Brevibacterium antiquum CNRZ 918]
MTAESGTADEEVELAGQLDLLDEIPGETRGTEHREARRRDINNDEA